MPDCSGRNTGSTQPDGERNAPLAKEAKAKSRFPNADPELVYELGRRKVELQLQQVEALDGKATGVFQAGGVLLALVGALFAIWSLDVPDMAKGPYAAGAGFFGVIVCLFVVGYLPKDWGIGPTMAETWSYSDKYSETTMYWWAAESFSKEAEDNDEKMKPKLLATAWLPVTFVGEAFELSIGLAFTLASV